MAPRTEHPAGALAFPGQGVAPADACATLRAHAGHELVEELAAGLGHDRWEELSFRDTGVSQPCTFLASHLSAADHVDPSTIDVVLGHSLGELAALVWAQALSPRTALALAFLRGRMCAEVDARTPGAMAAFMQLDPAELELVRRLALARAGGVLEVAAVNGPQQIILSGSAATVEHAATAARAAGALVVELAIGGGFHSPLMAEPFARFSEELATVDVAPPATAFVSTIRAAVVEDPDEIRRALALALVLPVRWHDSLAVLAARGVETCGDAGPGETLRKLGQRSGLVRFSRAGRPDPTVRATRVAST